MHPVLREQGHHLSSSEVLLLGCCAQLIVVVRLSPLEWSSAETFVQVEGRLLTAGGSAKGLTQPSAPKNSDCAALLPAASVAAKVQTYAAEESAHVPVMQPSTAQEGVAPVIAELLVKHEHLLTLLLDRNL